MLATLLMMALPALPASSGVLPERQVACTSTASPSLSPQALVEELSRAALKKREIDEAQRKLDADAAALTIARAALDADRKALDDERKAFDAKVAHAPKPKDAPVIETKPALPVPVPVVVDKPKAAPKPTADVGKIAKTLSGMKAAKAGAVLAQLDPSVAAQVVVKMKREVASAALETLTAEQAAKIATSISSEVN